MKILLKIAALAAVAALAAGCCSCRSYQKKNRRPLVGTEWQLIQLGGKAVKPEEGKFTLRFWPKRTASRASAPATASWGGTKRPRRAR